MTNPIPDEHGIDAEVVRDPGAHPGDPLVGLRPSQLPPLHARHSRSPRAAVSKPLGALIRLNPLGV